VRFFPLPLGEGLGVRVQKERKPFPTTLPPPYHPIME
jgi:hypothetical protein